MRPIPQRMSWKGLLQYLAYRSESQFGVCEPDEVTLCQACSGLAKVTALTVAVHHGIRDDGTCFGYEQHHRALPGEKPTPAYETTVSFWYCPKCDGDVPSLGIRTCVHTHYLRQKSLAA